MNKADFYPVSDNLDNEKAVSFLIDRCVLWVTDIEVSEERTPTISLSVLINDVFVPAADSMPLSMRDLPELLDLYLKHDSYGTIIWAMKKTKYQPRKRLKAKMVEEGLWNESFEQFAPNKY